MLLIVINRNNNNNNHTWLHAIILEGKDTAQLFYRTITRSKPLLLIPLLLHTVSFASGTKSVHHRDRRILLDTIGFVTNRPTDKTTIVRRSCGLLNDSEDGQRFSVSYPLSHPHRSPSPSPRYYDHNDEMHKIEHSPLNRSKVPLGATFVTHQSNEP
jgi:hypothetical protein